MQRNKLRARVANRMQHLAADHSALFVLGPVSLSATG